MSKKETIAEIGKFEKEYKMLNSKIEREFGKKDVFEEQYNKFKDQFMEEITKRSMNSRMLEDILNIILLNMYSYICNERLTILVKVHRSYWFKFIDDSNFKTKYLEITDKLNEIAPENLVTVAPKQVEDLRKIEKKDLRELIIVSEQSKKAKKNSMFFAVGIGAIFTIFGGIVTNLDRLSTLVTGMATGLEIIIGVVIPLFLGVITVLITGFLFDRFTKKKK